MSHVLLTGGSGFIGRSAAAELAQRGCDVTIASRETCNAKTPDKRIRFAKCDLSNLNDIDTLIDENSFDIFVHLAWETKHKYFWNAPENLDWVKSSIHLLQKFCEKGGRRFVSAGTCAEYDNTVMGKYKPDETPIRPENLYAVSKDAFHRVLRAYADEMELSYAWGRVFYLAGPYEQPTRLVPNVINSLLNGERALCSSGKQVFDYMDSRDCGSAFAQLALDDFEGALNIASGETYTIAEIAQKIGIFMDREDLVELSTFKNVTNSITADVEILQKEVGFKSQFTLEETLHYCIDWWANQRCKDI